MRWQKSIRPASLKGAQQSSLTDAVGPSTPKVSDTWAAVCCLPGPPRNQCAIPWVKPWDISPGKRLALQKTNSFSSSPRVAFSSLPLSDFWPMQLQQQKHLELIRWGHTALSSTSYFNSIWQQDCQKLLSHISAQSLKIMVTKLFIVTNLSAACTLVAGR